MVTLQPNMYILVHVTNYKEVAVCAYMNAIYFRVPPYSQVESVAT